MQRELHWHKSGQQAGQHDIKTGSHLITTKKAWIQILQLMRWRFPTCCHPLSIWPVFKHLPHCSELNKILNPYYLQGHVSLAELRPLTSLCQGLSEKIKRLSQQQQPQRFGLESCDILYVRHKYVSGICFFLWQGAKEIVLEWIKQP